MNGNDFLKLADISFTPFLKDMGFEKEKSSISGRHYLIRYAGHNNVISVSYEPGDDIFIILLLKIEKGQLSKIDDRSKTLRLSDLNKRYMQMVSIEERSKNEAFFKHIVTSDKEENLLLKAAKELRLVLPKYITSEEYTS